MSKESENRKQIWVNNSYIYLLGDGIHYCIIQIIQIIIYISCTTLKSFKFICSFLTHYMKNYL